MEFLSSGTTAFDLECAGTDSLDSEDNKRDGKNTPGGGRCEGECGFKQNIVFQFAVTWAMSAFTTQLYVRDLSEPPGWGWPVGGIKITMKTPLSKDCHFYFWLCSSGDSFQGLEGRRSMALPCGDVARYSALYCHHTGHFS